MPAYEVSSSFITPMKLWEKQGVQSLSNPDKSYHNGTSVSGTGKVPFQDVFQNVAEQVKTTQADVENQQYLLATGQLEDPHTLPIAEAKAQISLDLMISLRNKAMESYKELMQMSI